MKKQNLLSILLPGMFAVFQSCEKKPLTDTKNGTVKDRSDSQDNSINEKSIYDLVKVPNI